LPSRGSGSCRALQGGRDAAGGGGHGAACVGGGCTWDTQCQVWGQGTACPRGVFCETAECSASDGNGSQPLGVICQQSRPVQTAVTQQSVQAAGHTAVTTIQGRSHPARPGCSYPLLMYPAAAQDSSPDSRRRAARKVSGKHLAMSCGRETGPKGGVRGAAWSTCMAAEQKGEACQEGQGKFRAAACNS
jgi:hypothetical protein